MEEKLLTVRDVAGFLGISEKEVMNLAEEGKIPAYKVGGVYLRFRKDQVEGLRKTLHTQSRKPKIVHEYPVGDKVNDFFYFNDFYIVSIIIIGIMLFIIFRG